MGARVLGRKRAFLAGRTLGFKLSLTIAARNLGLQVQQQLPIRVLYRGIIVGEYSADLVVNNCVIAELKSARALSAEHEAQLLNYLKATSFEVGLLLNFGPKPEYMRRFFENSLKALSRGLKNEDAEERRRTPMALIRGENCLANLRNSRESEIIQQPLDLALHYSEICVMPEL